MLSYSSNTLFIIDVTFYILQKPILLNSYELSKTLYMIIPFTYTNNRYRHFYWCKTYNSIVCSKWRRADGVKYMREHFGTDMFDDSEARGLSDFCMMS